MPKVKVVFDVTADADTLETSWRSLTRKGHILMTNSGTRVFITEDCRDGGEATGQFGIYEGDFPFSVILGTCPPGQEDVQWGRRYSYDRYVSGSLLLSDGTPVKDVYIEWERGKEQPAPKLAMPIDNPRIRLADGSVIWGCECWWCEAKEDIDPAAATEALEDQKEWLGRVFNALQHEKDANS